PSRWCEAGPCNNGAPMPHPSRSYSSSFQGERYLAFRNGLIFGCFTVNALSSQSSVTPWRSDRLASTQAAVVRTQVSISAMGFWRVLMQSSQLFQCGTFMSAMALLVSATARDCLSLGKIQYPPRFTISVALAPWNEVPLVLSYRGNGLAVRLS